MEYVLVCIVVAMVASLSLAIAFLVNPVAKRLEEREQEVGRRPLQPRAYRLG